VHGNYCNMALQRMHTSRVLSFSNTFPDLQISLLISDTVSWIDYRCSSRVSLNKHSHALLAAAGRGAGEVFAGARVFYHSWQEAGPAPQSIQQGRTGPRPGLLTSLAMTVGWLLAGALALGTAGSNSVPEAGERLLPPQCAFDNIFGAGAPPYYVTYELPAGRSITIDGSLDDDAWQEVGFTRSNPDICGDAEHCPTAGNQSGRYPCSGNCCNEAQKPRTCGKPRFKTRQKIRWDEKYLYVGAELEEPQVWANNTQHDSIIFQDNDYEVFISPDGSNHYYKEYEMNARGAWWDLCLNKPYTNGGYENSSRVFRGSGWDDPGLKTAAKIHGCTLNDPSSGPCTGWSVEIAFPLAAISLNNSNSLPPRPGTYWRINFSRVEWKVHTEGNAYVLGAKKGDCACTWPCYPHGCTKNPGDNWLWAPLGIVDVHQPERWGYLQFAKGAVNATAVKRDPDWALRSVAMQLYCE
jgi:hypothetical protein